MYVYVRTPVIAEESQGHDGGELLFEQQDL
jgi:hypothetical protein